jgi:hypothetical protein
MTLVYTGTKDQPVAVASGSPATFAADLSDLGVWLAAGRVFRKFTTVTNLLAATGMVTNDIALAANAPGAWFFYNGTAWEMRGRVNVASAAARDTIFATPQLGYTVFRTDKGYSQIYYTAANGVATAGWYAEPGITYTVAPGTINPVPNAVTDYNSLSFTLGANELMVVQVDFMCGAQHNTAGMTSFWRVLLGAVVQATIDFNFTTANQNMPGYRQVRIVLPASTTSTIKNQAFASLATNAVFNGAGITIRTISPVTLS